MLLLLICDRWSSLTPAGEKPEKRITSAESVCLSGIHWFTREHSWLSPAPNSLPDPGSAQALPSLHAPLSQYKPYLKFAQLPSPKTAHHLCYTAVWKPHIYTLTVATGSAAGVRSTPLASWLQNPASNSRVAFLVTSSPFIPTNLCTTDFST